MAVNYEIVSEKIFNILKGFGYSVKSYNKEGEINYAQIKENSA